MLFGRMIFIKGGIDLHHYKQNTPLGAGCPAYQTNYLMIKNGQTLVLLSG